MVKMNETKSSESIIRFDQLSWKEIDDLDRSNTLFFLPISPLEEHGPHLPVGTDLITAQDTAIEAMKEIQKKHSSFYCILLPAIPLGYAGFNTEFPGTLSVSSRVVDNVVYNTGRMLAAHGFQFLMICTYHMALGHLKGIYKAMKKLRRKHDMVVCEPWGPVFYSDVISDVEPKVDFDTSKEVHAGFRETSLLLYSHPSFVRKEYVELPLVFNHKVMTASVLFNSFKKLGITQGYIGTPSKANNSYGKWFFDFTVKSYVDAAEAMIQNDCVSDLPHDIKRQMKLLFWL